MITYNTSSNLHIFYIIKCTISLILQCSALSSLNPIHLKSKQLQSKIIPNPPHIIVSYYQQLNPNYRCSFKFPTILPTQSIKFNLPTILLFRDWLLPPLTEEADFGQHQFQQVASVWVPDQMQLIHNNNACSQTKWLQVKLT